MRRARKKHFNNTSTINEPCKSVPRRPKGLSRPRSLTRRSNELTQMHCKSVPSRALAQSQMSTTVSSTMEDMTPSTCPPRTRTLDSTSMQRTLSMTLSSQEEVPNPITTISSLLQHQAQRASSKPGRSVAAKSSLSSVLQHHQTQSRSMSLSLSHLPLYVWLLPISSDNGSLPTFPQTSTSTLAPSVTLTLAVDLRQRRRS